VIVAGAGIGGLTAALSLHAAGIDVLVIDAAMTLRPLGVGINLMPHAVRELTELGLGDEPPPCWSGIMMWRGVVEGAPFRRRPSPRARSSGWMPTKWIYASAGSRQITGALPYQWCVVA
jgi:2-polyprenyl-6-methoxyphenol hydroxylase-like FAD-dependent oxidoreductase